MRWRPVVTAPVAALLAATLSAQDVPPAPATEVPAGAVTVGSDVMVVSRYVWRGYELSGGAPSVQPWLTLDHRSGFGINLFGASALDREVELDEAQVGVHAAFTPREGWDLDIGYLTYVMPGTHTEPSAGDDPLALTTAREAYVALSRPVGGVVVTLTYARGFGSARGNSVNLWVERELAVSGALVATPYVQADYLDQYGAPRTSRDRIAAVEAGVPLRMAVGSAALVMSAHLTWVTSPYVRAANAAAGTSRGLLPWLALGVSRGG